MSCGYEGADLQPEINEEVAHEQIDESQREDGLKPLRVDNFRCLLAAIARHHPAPARILDVGCAHGWFVEAAARVGYEVIGVEPDLHLANRARGRQLPVRPGYFPEALEPDERFDIIVFNDVFEHIPDLRMVLRHCRMHLKPDGLLVLNLPSSEGVFYRVSKLLAGLAMSAFFERLWQKGLPSPHVHYFHARNLRSVLGANGFTECESGTLATVQWKGLFTRISYTRDQPLMYRMILWAAIVPLLPLISLMPRDIIYTIGKAEGP